MCKITTSQSLVDATCRAKCRAMQGYIMLCGKILLIIFYFYSFYMSKRFNYSNELRDSDSSDVHDADARNEFETLSKKFRFENIEKETSDESSLESSEEEEGGNVVFQYGKENGYLRELSSSETEQVYTSCSSSSSGNETDQNNSSGT